VIYLYIGSGKLIRFNGMQDQDTGAYLNSGWTATWELWTAQLDAAGRPAPLAAVPGASGPMPYTAASDGNYEGLIGAAVTGGLTAFARYFVKGTFTNGASTDTRWLLAEARLRGQD